MVFAILSLLAAVTSMLAAMYAWKHPGSPGSRPFGLVSLGVAIWQFGYTCESISAALATLSAAVFWDNFEFLGATIVPAALLVFVLQYCGYRAGSARWLWALLAVEPIVTSTLVWTNPLHGLIRGSLAFTKVGPLTILSYPYGPWMWGSILYAYALMVIAVALLVHRYTRVSRPLRSQIHHMLIGMSIPWLGTFVTISGMLPVAHQNLDLSALTFTLGNLVWFWTLFRHRLFRIVPMAYETIVASIADGVILVDGRRRVVLINPAAEQILGCQAKEATGRLAEQVFAGWPELAACFMSDQQHRIEIASGNGETRRTYDVKISVVRDAGNLFLQDVEQDQSVDDQPAACSPDSVIAIIRDVTVRKQGEAELATARDLALEAARLKSEFLATMSHEIRTPLSTIIGMSEILLDTELDARQREFAAMIGDSSQLLFALINDILDFSKIEAGKLTLARAPFELRKLVEGAAGLLAARARNKGLELRTSVAPELPAELIGDEMRLRQVLLNLIANAVKFTERGHVLVHIDLEHETPELVQVRFVVIDTGIGLSEGTRQRLFQPFTQANSSTTRKYGGTGLGLAISRRLSEAMGGTIGVESAEGHGSTFWFTASFARADACVDAPPAPPPAMRLTPPINQRTPSLPVRARQTDPLILLAEDNDVNRRMETMLIERMGYQVHAVENGLEALEAFVRAPGAYALILMDVQMPELDGYATTARIRAAESGTGRRIPIIAVTANVIAGIRERCLAAGMDDYLSKPIDGEAMRAMIAGWLA